MSKKEKTALVPKLRFPEFRGSGEWEEKTLEEVAHFVNTKISVKKLKANQYISTENILQDFAGIESSNKLPQVDNVTRFETDDILISNIRPYLKKIWLSNMVGGVSNDILVVRAKKINPNFLSFLLKNDEFISYMTAGARGVKMPRGDISLIKRYPIFVPKENNNFPKAEQQKIADCLSSLDDLIIAEDKKLAALKLHKKGLMQKLFPAEGKTVPEWRFPEFRNCGEWEENSFKAFIKLYRGSSPRPIQNYFTKNDGVNWIKIGDTKNSDGFKIRSVEEQITHEGAQKSRFVTSGELILANSMSFGKTYELEISGCIYDGWFVLREYEEHFNKQFLLQQLNSDKLQKQYSALSAGGVVQNISSDIVYATILKRPHLKEQQKIADFLASIDTYIAAQSEKIEALKSHKRGLTQGLFPSIEEVGK